MGGSILWTCGRAALAALLLAGATGCLGGSSGHESVSGEPLRRCASQGECNAGLECLCQVCTRACASDNGCSDLGDGATCMPTASTSSCSAADGASVDNVCMPASSDVGVGDGDGDVGIAGDGDARGDGDGDTGPGDGDGDAAVDDAADAGTTGSGGSGATTEGYVPFECGVESCGEGQTCCPATGLCYEQGAGTSCPGVGCGIGPAGPADCCPDGLAFCEDTSACHHPGCTDCCKPTVSCNDHDECETGYLCCYSSRTCYHPSFGSCSEATPRCDEDGACPGNLECCTQHDLCFPPDCTDCCPTDCAPAAASCATGTPCCGDLACCTGVPVPPGEEYCSSSCPVSDRNVKKDIVPVDGAAILAGVERLPISAWSYRDEDGVRHVGPMAQDFHATFGLGQSDTCIPTIDSGGVALAAIQALAADVAALRAEIEALRKHNLALEHQLATER